MKAIIQGQERTVISIESTIDPDYIKVKFVNVITKEIHSGPAELVSEAVYDGETVVKAAVYRNSSTEVYIHPAKREELIIIPRDIFNKENDTDFK